MLPKQTSQLSVALGLLFGLLKCSQFDSVAALLGFEIYTLYTRSEQTVHSASYTICNLPFQTLVATSDIVLMEIMEIPLGVPERPRLTPF